VVIGVPGQVIARSRPHLATDRPDLESALMPDLLGSSLQSLLLRVDKLETVFEGHANHQDVRSSEAGVWPGEDFSIRNPKGGCRARIFGSRRRPSS
jgi:serine O-acetyltransferase